MYSYDFWKIQEQIQSLKNEITELKAANQKLQKKMATLQPIQIEKMEYKIHELVVKTLSGTLNIGLTAHGDEESIVKLIEKMQKEDQLDIDIEDASTSKGAD